MANLSTGASCVADSRLGVSVSASVSQGGQSIDGNYTTVNYSYSASQAGSLGFSGTTRANAGSLVLIINGQTVVNVALPLTHGISVGQGITSGSGSVRVGHNADGSKTASIELKIVAGSDPRGANYYWGSSSTSSSITLSNIPRASYPTVSASSKTLGETIVITTNRKSSNFTHSLWWVCGDSGWQGIASGVGDSYSWTIPRDIAKRITSSTSATITIVCRTYSGNTQIGSNQTVTFTGNVPSDIKPSASGLSVSEAISAVKSKFGVYLKGQSKLAISFNESGSYGSWITSRKIECNNQTFWSTSATTDYLYTSGSLKVTATVTDSRGRSASVSTTVTVYDYGTPWVNALRGIRCSSDGTDTDDGEYLKIQFSAGVTSVSNKNSAIYQLGYRLSNSGNYSYKTLGLSALSYDNATTGVIAGLTFAMDKTYDIVLVVTDKLGLEARRSDVVSTAFELINYYPDGSGMAIGKFAESPNLFDVGLNTKFRKAIYADDGICTGDSTYYGAPIYGANNAPAWIHLGTWTSGGDAHNCMITVFTGAGYNSQASQNTTIKINIKDGWQSSLSASSSFGITYEITGAYYSNIKVKGIAQAHNILDVWVYLPWTYWNGDYIFQGFGAWKHIATCQSAEPTGNEQSCAETAPAWIQDSKNGNKLTMSYYKDGMGINSIDWLACWNGAELRAINKSEIASTGYDSSSGWSWAKFSNGILIQHRFSTFSKSWQAWGGLYSIDINRQNGNDPAEISDYPIAFTQTPTRTISLADGSTGNAISAFPDTDGMKRPLNNFGGFVVTRPSNASMTYVFSLMAIGWWK